jgi:hypothetical protein
MALFGKKEPPPAGAKREFPAALEAGLPEEAVEAAPAQRKGSDAPARPAATPGAVAASPQDSPLVALTERLEHLGRLLDQARDQVTAYLVDREAKLDRLSGGSNRGMDQKLDALYGKLDQVALSVSRAGVSSGSAASAEGAGLSEAALKSAVRPLADKLDQVDAKCKSLAERPAAVEALRDAFVQNLVKVRDGLSEQHTALGGGLRQLQELLPQYFNALPQYFTAIQQQVAAVQQRVEAGLRAIAQELHPPEPEPSKTPAIGGDWQGAILGRELADNPALEAQRQQLFSGMLAGEASACSLVGNLMIFRSSPAERMPTLLKEIGEAYYRWHPRATNQPSEMEKALVASLERACAEAGIPNTIELVHPGERFDAMRHNAPQRGVEITQVLGWVVLRDNGKVYTKASVAVK